MRLNVNGLTHDVDAEPETSLLEVLRDDLALTGTKYGCGESQCGACTVLVDGNPTHACVTPLSELDGASVTTIESLEHQGKLHPIQQAFLDEGAMQCAYCVPGMIMAAAGLLRKNSHPTRDEIVTHMAGNICRCGGYPRMVAAIERAAAAMRTSGGGQ